MILCDTAERGILCASCQAELPARPDDRLLHCPACDSFSRLTEDGGVAVVEKVVLQPAEISRDEVERVARKWMAEGFWKAADLAEVAQLTKVEGIALPFWALKVQARTYWSGMNKRTRTVGTGDQRRSQIYWEPVSGDFSKERNWTLYARKDPAEIMGLEAADKGGGVVQANWGRYLLGFQPNIKPGEIRDLRQGAEPFSSARLFDMQIVPGEFDRAEAEQQALRELEARGRRKADHLADRLIDCDTAIDIQALNLVYLPLWQIEYAYRGRIYHLLINGNDGSIVSAEHPVGKWDKVVLTAIIMSALAAAGALAAWLIGMPSLWIIPYACAGVVALHASWTALFSRG